MPDAPIPATRWRCLSGRRTRRANSRNRYSFLATDLGWGPLLTALTADLIAPVAAVLLPAHATAANDGGGDGGLRFHHAHTIQRVADGAQGSAACPLPGSNRGSRHFDDADVTFNVNIGGEWEGGGELSLFGHHREIRDVATAKEAARVPNALGWAVLHPGALLHQARRLSGGCRMNLVVWCKRAPRAS